jgi:hypothetical protein
LAAPYILFRFGLMEPRPGNSVRVRLRLRTIEIVGKRGTFRTLPWSAFDAFDFGRWQGFDLLKLRRRQWWLTRGRQSPTVLAFEIGMPGTDLSTIREVLIERGLREETLGTPSFLSDSAPARGRERDG